MRLLQQKYLAALPEKYARLHALWEQLLSDYDSETHRNLIRGLHNLAGSAGSFGLPLLSDKARELEKIMRALPDDIFDADTRASITQALEALGQLARHEAGVEN